ncbi:MAG: class I SAM-dependent methyltransferase [Myxococcales bacterium]
MATALSETPTFFQRQRRLPLWDQARYRAFRGALALSAGPLLSLWHRSIDREYGRPPAGAPQAVQRLFRELLAEDIRHVSEGVYPRELLFDPPLPEALRTWPEALADAPRIWSRTRRKRFDDLPAEAAAQDFPDYYRRNFHFQTDGWLSERSARMYDAQVGFLFFGTLPLMRRMGLPPLVWALRGRRGARLLDVGCGTGRFLRQLHLALPQAKLYGLDLSPYYLQAAERNVAAIPGVSLLSENAEAIPMQSGSVAAAVSTFVFHELPHEVRRRVVREIHRVLAPGGVFVLVDSLQKDGPAGREVGWYLDWFPRIYHEPYYKSWLGDEAGALLTECGFALEEKRDHLFACVAVGHKPAG